MVEKIKVKSVFIFLISFLKRTWFFLTKKRLDVFHVHIHAPVAIANTHNYIEWIGKYISHSYIKTNSGTKLVNGSRYYFKNNLEHKKITLILEGYNSEKKYSYLLNYISINKKEVCKPVLIEKPKKDINSKFQLKTSITTAIPSVTLNEFKIKQTKTDALNSINLNLEALNNKLNN